MSTPSRSSRPNVSTSRRDVNAGNTRVSGTRPTSGTRDLSGAGTRNTTGTRDTARDRQTTRDREVSRDIERDVEVDVDGGDWDDDWGEGFFVGAVVGGTIGAAAYYNEPTVIYSLPPSCSTVVSNGVTYQNCGGVYYQPSYQGTTVAYQEVAPP